MNVYVTQRLAEDRIADLHRAARQRAVVRSAQPRRVTGGANVPSGRDRLAGVLGRWAAARRTAGAAASPAARICCPA